ncbi:MAG TPA: farnesyl diphosphate synthase [Steroidobacteraceae bacterium]|nr:farnesyl diphosphate synthase [Steroidobacteraceae bacterium]
MSDSRSLAARLAGWRTRVEQKLAEALALPDPGTARLGDAMRYSSLGGGKRLRPMLVYVTGTALGAQPELLDDAAVAVELIHVYSLVHDDLPAMDDDDLRRGRPTCHKAFDEGTAVLVGDALQALAFEVLAGARGDNNLTAAARLQQIQVLAAGIGTAGMAGGQALDLEAVGRQLDAPAVEAMHRRKTGALIRASVLLGAIGAGVVRGVDHEALARYGAELGLAFQIQDDVLDVAGATESLGKTAGADAARGKPTYPSVHGLAAAASLARAHRDAAITALGNLADRAPDLVALADLVVERDH